MNERHLIYGILTLLILFTWDQVRATSLREQLVQVRSELASKREPLRQLSARREADQQLIGHKELSNDQQARRMQKAEKTRTGLAVITLKDRGLAQLPPDWLHR